MNVQNGHRDVEIVLNDVHDGEVMINLRCYILASYRHVDCINPEHAVLEFWPRHVLSVWGVSEADKLYVIIRRPELQAVYAAIRRKGGILPQRKLEKSSL